MKTSYSPNVKIPVDFIIEIGLCRKRNVCALCGNKMNVPDHNIQLCKNCRLNELDKFASTRKSE